MELNSLEVVDFDLKYTIESGQFFLFDLIDDFYYIVLRDIVFKVKQEGDTLFYDNISENELKKFLSLNLDLKSMTSSFNDEYLIAAKDKFWGLRLLNQDLWQCIIGFICSQCSNIPKIKMNMKNICKAFGYRVIYDDMEFYTFPNPGDIDNLEKLRGCKVGYRAEYIYNFNNLVLEDNFLQELEGMGYEDAMKSLVQLNGIGNKVASCICLYGLSLENAFPIDVWIKRVIEEFYFNGEKMSMRKLEEFVASYFKEHAGLKQQYLFHYVRNR